MAESASLLHPLVRDLSRHLDERRSTRTQTRHELKSNAERIDWLDYKLTKFRCVCVRVPSANLSADQPALWQSRFDEQIAETEVVKRSGFDVTLQKNSDGFSSWAGAAYTGSFALV